MKQWQIVYPGENNNTIYEILNEVQILNNYYDYWSNKMFNIGKGLQATENNCIEDWVVVHWALEIK